MKLGGKITAKSANKVKHSSIQELTPKNEEENCSQVNYFLALIHCSSYPKVQSVQIIIYTNLHRIL